MTVKFTHTDLLLGYKTAGSYLHRISTTMFLLYFLLCGKERSLLLGFAVWYRHSVPAWCNLPVRQWQDCPIKGCPPTALSQSDCTVGTKRHPYTIAVLLLAPSAIDSWDKLRLLWAASSQPCGNGSAGLQLEKGMQRSGGCHPHIQVYQSLWHLLLPLPASENMGIVSCQQLFL